MKDSYAMKAVEDALSEHGMKVMSVHGIAPEGFYQKVTGKSVSVTIFVPEPSFKDRVVSVDIDALLRN